MAGMLYVCATPIGNLEDMTYRVVRVLGEADVIAAEDTRNSRKLLDHFDIHTPMTSYHEYNKFDKGRELVGRMLAGENVALITDAGMPGISDPGEELVKMCYEAGVEVTVLPGACAFVTALVLSGQKTRRLAFEAFLPMDDKKERRELLENLKEETRTIILYEAPHRLVRTLTELRDTLGEERSISVVRELTKKHETVNRTTLGEAVGYYTENEPRGECVLVLAGKSKQEKMAETAAAFAEMSVSDHVALYEARGMDRKEAMKAAANDRGVGKRDIYRALLEEQGE